MSNIISLSKIDFEKIQMLYAMTLSTMSPMHKAVLGRLIFLRPYEYLSMKNLSRQLRISTATASKCIGWLEENRVITVNRWQSKKSPWKYNLYTVNDPIGWQNVEYAKNEVENPPEVSRELNRVGSG